MCGVLFRVKWPLVSLIGRLKERPCVRLQIASMGTFQVLKLPLGFIRVLEWVSCNFYVFVHEIIYEIPIIIEHCAPVRADVVGKHHGFDWIGPTVSLLQLDRRWWWCVRPHARPHARARARACDGAGTVVRGPDAFHRD